MRHAHPSTLLLIKRPPPPPRRTHTVHPQVGQADNVRAVGNKAGTIANQLVQVRANDGSATVLPEERGSTANGMWRPTPPDFRSGSDTQWGRVTPWVVENVSQNFRMPPPPALNSETYRQAYMEVRGLAIGWWWWWCLVGSVQISRSGAMPWLAP